MAYQINVSKDAEKDILTAKCYFRISGLEYDFDSDLISQIAYLKANPFLFQGYYRNIRRFHFSSFRYSIHFVIKNNVVFILRVLHHKQAYK